MLFGGVRVDPARGRPLGIDTTFSLLVRRSAALLRLPMVTDFFVRVLQGAEGYSVRSLLIAILLGG
jgi:hypothetical protein